MTVSGMMLHVRWRANSVELLFTFDCQSWFIHVFIHYIISKTVLEIISPHASWYDKQTKFCPNSSRKNEISYRGFFTFEFYYRKFVPCNFP